MTEPKVSSDGLAERLREAAKPPPHSSILFLPSPSAQLYGEAADRIDALTSEHSARLKAEASNARMVKALEEMRDVCFGVSGKSSREINEWFNNRAREALAQAGATS